MPRNTQNNRGAGNRSRSKNNNPEGHNQYNNGWMDTARERPVAAAGLAAAAVGAGVFLWSRRRQISEQITNLSDQFGEWSENMNSRGSSEEFEMAGGESSFSGSASRGSGSEFSGRGMSSSGASGTTAGGFGSGNGMGSTGASGSKGVKASKSRSSIASTGSSTPRIDSGRV